MCPKITRPFTVRFCDLFSLLTGVVTRKKLVSPFKKTIATNPLNHCIESSIPPCQFSFSPWFFFRFRPINAILFQFSMSILPLVNETIQWFRFIEIYFTFDYRYCVRFSTLLSVSSSGEHNFWSSFFSILSLLYSSIFFSIFRFVSRF